jgi:8-oxo-dGTP diphosphatase
VIGAGSGVEDGGPKMSAERSPLLASNGERAQSHAVTGPTARVWPRVAASTAVFRGDEVLLVERGKEGAGRGLWSLPGGHIEPGETARAAAEREVFEETGVAIDMGGLVDVHDVIVRAGSGELTAHYVLAVHWGVWRAGEPVAATDVIAARFVAIEAIAGLATTAGLDAIVRKAVVARDR